jgi:hypothetical protein
MSTDELGVLKSVEHYSASVTAWYNTHLEHDKSLLTLSAGGIGLLVTLLTTGGVPSAEGLVLYIAALCCFVVCLGSVLAILKQNGKYVEALVKGDAPPPNSALPRLDSVAIYSFVAGVVFAVVIGISAAVTSYSNKEKTMATENKSSSDKAVLRESFAGAANLKPDLGKSFTGAENLKPSVPASSGSTTTGQGGSTSQPSNKESGGK